MRRERGNELYVAGTAVLALVLIVAAGLWYLGAERAKAFAAGEVAERGRWQARESEELRQANAQLVAAQARIAKLELQAAQDLVALEEEHDKEMDRVQADRNRFMDDLVNGRLRFHARAPAGEGAGCRAAGAAATAGAARDEEAGGELPDALSRAVAGGASLAAEADEVVLTLTEAQGVIETYRRACSAF